MGIYAMEQALRTYGYGAPKTEIFQFEKVACPICGHMCGGKSGLGGERGRLEGVHAHLKFKHGMKRKWERDALIEGAE